MHVGDHDPVNKAFSRQSAHYDHDDLNNVVLQDLRKQIYKHVDGFLLPGSRILELNAGTGIDAVRFVREGHHVHATDLSNGMVEQLERKKTLPGMERLTIQQLSYHHLDRLTEKNFDLVFSNFGGLNCTDDLAAVGSHLPSLLKPGGHVTWVVMPVVSAWEIASVVKGNRAAFRRWNRSGTMARLEGEQFRTWYHPLSSVRKALNKFELLKVEGIASVSPPPHKIEFPLRYPRVYKLLRIADSVAGRHFPFNRWADHIIATFKLKENA
jgi:ubiquinone/menaquinone biosynthesis C-methylase UbiE